MCLSQLNRFVLGLLFILIYTVSHAQDIDVDQLISKYPGESEIIIKDDIKYIIKEKKNKLKIISESHYESLIINERGINNFTESYFDSELVPVLSHEAFTINKNDKKIKTNLSNETSRDNNSVFFDDIKEIEITYKGLEPGARKILKHKKEFLDANLLHRFLFKKHLPVEKTTFTMEVDKDIEIGYKLMNFDQQDIIFTKEEKRSKTIYTWKANQLPAYKYEDNMPGILYTEPHIAIYVKSFIKDDERVELLGNVDNLFNYYTTFVENLNKKEDPELAAIAKDITSELSIEEEKVKAIYYWVKENIKYVAYENGYEGFIPREASLVCTRKFGDCKDMSSIITAMCKSVGINNVKLTWIGTRDIPYTYTEMPTPAVDNHMIATYVKGDEYIYLDGTDQETAFGLPSSFIQGKQALIYFDDKKYELAVVPIISAEKNIQSTSNILHLENNVIRGKGTNIYKGLARSRNIGSTQSLNEKRRFKNIKSKVLLGSNKFILDDYTILNDEDRDKPLQIDYTFHLDNYIVSLEDDLYLNMFLRKYSILKKFEKDRTKPFEFSNLIKWENDFTLELADNEEVVSLPEDFLIDNELVEFVSKFEQHEDKVKLTYTLKLKKLLIYPNEFELWNKTVKKIKKVTNKTVILKSTK